VPGTTRHVADLLAEVRACTVCAADLPAGPRPIVQFSAASRIVIIGQAPGRRVHESGVPWDDPSGDTLRGWLGLDADRFYDPDALAVVPMGFCYPGSAASGDRPPRRECAPLWHERILHVLPPDRLTIVIGSYARARYAPDAGATLDDAVAAWERLLPDRIVLPHPSPRNRHWVTKRPWFDADVLPALRARVSDVLDR
jgi:uracil-DNA glycosylase